MEECQRMLHPADYAKLSFCQYDPPLAMQTTAPTGSIFLDRLMMLERVLAVNIATLRAQKLNRKFDAGEFSSDIPRTAAVARHAFDLTDPLEAMLYIDRARWGAIDTILSLDDMFGANTVFAQMLKLKLLERKQCLNPEIGAKNYQGHYNAILDEYHA